jgi:adenylate cyclase
MMTVADTAGEQPEELPAYLVIAEGDGQGRVAIFDQLFVGRECAGISETRWLLIPDTDISRTHFEIRLDAAADQAFIIDTSSNGTTLNGMRLARAVMQRLRPGDEIRIADVVMTFHSQRFTAATRVPPQRTPARISQSAMVMVVGDIVDYSMVSQTTGEGVVAESLNALWRELDSVLRAHQGTLSHYAGDALLAVWELLRFPDAAELATAFALAANQLVEQVGPELPLRNLDGSPIRMGWGVVVGKAAVAPMTGSVVAVIGDSTNVAFRLAGLAGRDGRAPVMATHGVRRAAADKFAWGEGELVELKGRRGTETVYPVVAPR